MVQPISMYSPSDTGVITPDEILSNAVILQAVKDFRSAKRRLKRKPDDREAMKEIKEIARFFRSGYFCSLTRLDGPTLLRRLFEEGGDVFERA